MINRLTVLVLGAGASVPYGFPTGPQLRREILALGDDNNAVGWHSPEQWVNFQHTFRQSERGSIDSFLGQHNDLVEVGSFAIAMVLLKHEAEAKLFDDDIQGHWYRYLFNALTEHVKFGDLDFSKLKVITFNYDRSLERYLVLAIQNAYRVAPGAALEALKSLEVVHVYGSLSAPRPGMPEHLLYGMAPRPDLASTAAKCVRIMAEGRDDSDELVKARQWLTEAQVLGILGFAFDPLNMQRLKSIETMNNRYGRDGLGVEKANRTVAATCLGMTGAEARRAANFCGIRPIPDTGLPPGFWNEDCLQMLRETLILV